MSKTAQEIIDDPNLSEAEKVNRIKEALPEPKPLSEGESSRIRERLPDEFVSEKE